MISLSCPLSEQVAEALDSADAISAITVAMKGSFMRARTAAARVERLMFMQLTADCTMLRWSWTQYAAVRLPHAFSPLRPSDLVMPLSPVCPANHTTDPPPHPFEHPDYDDHFHAPSDRTPSKYTQTY